MGVKYHVNVMSSGESWQQFTLNDVETHLFLCAGHCFGAENPISTIKGLNFKDFLDTALRPRVGLDPGYLVTQTHQCCFDGAGH